MFDRFGGSKRNGCASLVRGGVSANVKLRHLTYVMRSMSSVFSVSAVGTLESRMYGLSNGRCKVSRRASISLHIIASRVHSMAFVISSNVLPSGDNHKCILHHLLEHTYHRKGLLKVSKTFLMRLTAAMVRNSGSKCPRLRRGGRFVFGMVTGRRTGFGGAVSRKLTVLTSVRTRVRGGKRGILSKRGTFGLCSACKFPVSLADRVLRRGKLACSRRKFGGTRRRRHTGSRKAFKARSCAKGRISMCSRLSTTLTARFIKCSGLAFSSGIATLAARARIISTLSSKRGKAVVIRRAPFCTAVNKRRTSGNIVHATSKRFIMRSYVRLTKAGIKRMKRIMGKVVGVNSMTALRISTGGHTLAREGRDTARLLRGTLHAMLKDRMRRTKSFMGTSELHFSFARFSTMAPRRLGGIRRVIGRRVAGTLTIIAGGLPVRRTEGAKTRTLFNRGCNSIMHIMSVDKFSIRFYNNARIGGASRVATLGVVSRDNMTTNIHHVRTLASRKLVGCCTRVRRLLGRTTRLMGTAPSGLTRGVARLRTRGGSLGKRIRDLGDGVTRGTTKSVLSRIGRMGNIGLLTTRLSNISVGKLHSLKSRLGRGLNRNIIMLTSKGSKGMDLVTATASKTVGRKTRTKGLIGTVTNLINKNNNNHPGVTRTNKGGPTKVRSTLTGTRRTLTSRVGWDRYGRGLSITSSLLNEDRGGMWGVNGGRGGRLAF